MTKGALVADLSVQQQRRVTRHGMIGGRVVREDREKRGPFKPEPVYAWSWCTASVVDLV